MRIFYFVAGADVPALSMDRSTASNIRARLSMVHAGRSKCGKFRHLNIADSCSRNHGQTVYKTQVNSNYF